MSTPELEGRLTLDDQASKKVDGFLSRIKAMEGRLKSIGKSFTVFGAAITGVAALSVKSSIDQQIGIRRLDQALKGVGTSYDKQREAIEKVIEAQQRKTNFGDEAQREALVLLTAQLGSSEKALQVLPTVLDAAAFSGKDLNAVLQTMPRFFAGISNTSIAAGISVDKLTTFEERLALVQANVNGQAAAAADPMIQMKNRIGDLAQVLGDALLPIVTKASNVIEALTRNIIEWTAEHPTLSKVIALVVVGVGALMLVVGPLLIALPFLISGFIALGPAVAIATGPIGLLVIGIAALVTGVILLAKNWEKIWNRIGPIVEGAVNKAIKVINIMTLGFRNQFALIADGVASLARVFNKDLAESISNVADKLRKGIPEVNIFTESIETVKEAVEETVPPLIKVAEAVTRVALGFREAGTATEEFQTKLSEAIIASQQRLADAGKTQEAIAKAGAGAHLQVVIDGINASLEAQRLGDADELELLTGKAKRDQIFENEERERKRLINSQIAQDRIASIRKQILAEERMRESIDRTIERWAFAGTEAGKLNLSIDKVGLAFVTQGGSADLARRALEGVGGATGSVEKFLDLLGISVTRADQLVQGLSKSLDVLERVATQPLAQERFNQVVAQRRQVQQQVLAVAQRAFSGGDETEGLRLTRISDEMRLVIQSAIQAFNQGGSVPGFKHGGTVPGVVGQPMLATVHGGETITPPGKEASINVQVFIGDEQLDDRVIRVVRDTKLAGGFI